MYYFRKVFLLISIYTYLSAGEVDSLYAAGKDINDSSQIINMYLNEQIEILINDLPESFQNNTCENVSLHLMEELGSTDYFFFKAGALNTLLELWAEENRYIDRVPSFGTAADSYSQESIYAPELKFFELWSAPVDSTMNIAGIYIGAEKLSHFIGSGYEYYQKYLRVLRLTGSEEEAQFEAIRWGIELEASIIGTWAVGIFSYADLEANYQGFVFAKDLCTQKLQYYSGRWQLVEPVDIRRYVNPNWDEAYNPNSYSPSRQEGIQKNINNLDICRRCDWQALQKRYKFYEDRYSTQVRREWLDTGLSSSLLGVLQTTPSNKQNLYKSVAKRYGLKWSYKQFSNFFGEDLTHMKAIPFESYCPVRYSKKYQAYR